MAHLCTATMQNAEQYETWKKKREKYEKKTEESIKMMMNKSLRYARI